MGKLVLVLIIGSLASGCANLSGVNVKGALGFATPDTNKAEVLAVGQGFSQLESEQRLISNKLEMAAWFLNNENAPIDAAAATESIDFSTHKLIYVAAGMKPHAGYSLALSEGGFSSAGGAASLKLRLEQPTLGSFYSSKVASPYILVKVPANDYRHINIQYEACDQQQQILVSR